MKLFSIYDKRTAKHSEPFTALNEQVAMRLFSHAVNTENKDNQLRNYAEDFELRKLADYDDEGGTITAYEPELIAKAQNVLRNTEK